MERFCFPQLLKLDSNCQSLLPKAIDCIRACMKWGWVGWQQHCLFYAIRLPSEYIKILEEFHCCHWWNRAWTLNCVFLTTPKSNHSDFDGLDKWFSYMPHICTRLAWFERSQCPIGLWQRENAFIIRDVGIGPLLGGGVYATRHGQLVYFFYTL